VIPEGQRFRVREDGRVGEYFCRSMGGRLRIILKFDDDRNNESIFDFPELEPVFG
jgi:hypothetical protein